MFNGDGVVFTGPALIVIERLFVAVRLIRSVTLKTIVLGPKAVVGVPVIAPLEEFKERPGGKLPEIIDQV